MTDREKVIQEALSWLKTPYRLGGRIKSVGCDCATFILCVMVNCGVFTDERLGHYAQDWWRHTTDDNYVMSVLRHAPKVAEAICYRTVDVQPGNIVLVKAAGSRVRNHGAIVIDYPTAVHSIHPCVSKTDLSTDPMWAYHEIQIFDPFMKEA